MIAPPRLANIAELVTTLERARQHMYPPRAATSPALDTCAYCGIKTDAPCGFLSVSLGCTKAYYARRSAL